jgi:hypothetical protein
VSNLKRISVLYTGLEGLPGTNTIYGHEDGVSAADQVTAVRNFFGAIAGSLKSGLSIQINSVVEIVDSTNGEITGTDDTSAGGTVNGASSQQLLPLTTQALVQLRTGTFFTGRELRGRFFIPGWCETENDAGKPTSGALGLVNTALDTLVGSANLAVFSPTKFQWASVSSAQMWSEWAVLRSRRD